ncbi:MAG: LolA-like putative outer membrane lipoprotein chaperone [Dysgonomonas sp.]
MKLRFKLLFLICSVFAISLHAQNAKTILDKASETYNKSGGITASFSLDTKDVKNKTTYSLDGKAYMKGNKFKIDVPDGVTWFDGKTQWVYVKDTEEVNVSNPTGEELQSISPAAIFGIYKSGFNLVYKGEKRLNSKLVYEIEMTPQKKNADISKIIVQIDKITNMFSKVTMVDKSGLENILSIKSFEQGALSDAIFAFNKKDYPKADVIDLR